MKDVSLKVQGMHCGSCEKLVTMTLGKIPGVKVKRVDHKSGEVALTLEDETSLPKVRQAIEGLKFQVVS